MPGTKRIVVSLCGTAALVLPVANAHAQVHGPGPSDPALFDTVIDLPADQATISGSVGNELGDATPTTQLNVADGGSIESEFNAYAGSEVNINGGVVGSSFEAQAGSEVNVSGGVIGSDFNVLTGSNTQFVGGQFRLNGAAYPGPTVDLLGVGDTFSGILADGTPFIFSTSSGDRLENVALVTSELPEFDTTPIVVDTDVSDNLYGVGPGQTLTLQQGGILPSFFDAIGAALILEGGDFGRAQAVDSTILVSGDTEYLSLEVSGESVVNIEGGIFRSGQVARHGGVINFFHTHTVTGSSFFLAGQGGEINIHSGTAGRLINSRDGGVVNISGGRLIDGVASFRSGVRADAGGILNVSGGDFSLTFFNVLAEGQLNLFGTEFHLDGVSLQDHLSFDQAFILTDRGGALLTGTLADGSAIEIVLDSTFSSFPTEDSFSSGSTLTLTLVSELAGDYNSDGFISQADLDLVLLNWGETVLPFEFNQAGLVGGPFDGLVSQNELDQVLLNWGDGAAPNLDAIPEPTTAGLLGVVGWATLARRRRGGR